MAHQLTMRSNGSAEIAYVGDTPWHGLGQELQAGASLEEWAHAAGMDWDIGRSRVRYAVRPEDADAPDQWVTSDSDIVLFRRDNFEKLGIVSPKYVVVQPRDVLEFFRDLTAEAGMTLETAGTLFGGRRFWALAKIGEGQSVADKADVVNGYVLLNTSADGSTATEARQTDIRVVCNNTLSAARYRKAAVKVPHSTTFDAVEVKRRMSLDTSAVRERFEREMESARAMAATRATKAAMLNMTLELFGISPETMSAEEAKTAATRSEVVSIATLATTGEGLIGAGLRGCQDTNWGWLNAVTQHVDHVVKASTPSHKLERAWFGGGNKLKERAHEIALRHSGGSVTTYAEVPEGADESGLLDAILANPVAA